MAASSVALDRSSCWLIRADTVGRTAALAVDTVRFRGARAREIILTAQAAESLLSDVELASIDRQVDYVLDRAIRGSLHDGAADLLLDKMPGDARTDMNAVEEAHDAVGAGVEDLRGEIRLLLRAIAVAYYPDDTGERVGVRLEEAADEIYDHLAGWELEFADAAAELIRRWPLPQRASVPVRRPPTPRVLRVAHRRHARGQRRRSRRARGGSRGSPSRPSDPDPSQTRCAR